MGMVAKYMIKKEGVTWYRNRWCLSKVEIIFTTCSVVRGVMMRVMMIAVRR